MPTNPDWPQILSKYAELRAAGHSCNSAADILGVPKQTLYSRLRSAGIEPPPLAQNETDRQFSYLWNLNSSYASICKRMGISLDDALAIANRLNLPEPKKSPNAKHDWRALDPIILKKLDAGETVTSIARDLNINRDTLHRRVLGVLDVKPPERVVMPMDDVTARITAGWIERGGAGPAIMHAIAQIKSQSASL